MPAPSLHAQPFITDAPRDIAGWMLLFDVQQLPVLASSAAILNELVLVEDRVDAHMLSESVANDPLLTLRLLAHVAELRRGREGGEPETVTEALVMLGISPFFRAFEGVGSAEQQLQDRPQALAGFSRVLQRSHRAARFAIGFAAHRMDHDAAVIHEAALLHDFAELLLWLKAPTLALQICLRQQADPTLRSAAVQQELLHVRIADLQHALMKRWRLPALLVRITDGQSSKLTDQVRNVQLAIRIARHSAQGWDNAALPDDIREVAELLHLGVEPATRLLHEIDLED